jgi:excisionase family DNA binding protein
VKDQGYDIQKVSEMLDLSPSTTRRLIKSGELKAVRASARRLIVMESEIQDYVSRRMTVAA